MKKIYTILLALLMLPVFAFADNTNKAIQQTSALQSTYTSHWRLRVPVEAAGIVRNTVDNLDQRVANATDYTVGMWFKPTAFHKNTSSYYTADCNTVLADLGTHGQSNANGNWVIAVNNSDGMMKTLGHGGDDQHGIQSVKASGDLATLSLNEWHHLVMVVDNTNLQLTFYLDNVQIVQKAMTKVMVYDWSDDYDLHFAGLGFQGYLDEVQLFNSALTAEQVAAAHIDARAISSLTGLYTFDEEESSTGTFANMAPNGDASLTAVWNKEAGRFYSNGGLVPVNSSTATSPTLADGREIIASEINVVPAPATAGGYYTISDGTTTWTINEEFTDGMITVAGGTELTFTAYPQEGYSLIGFFTMDGENVTYLDGNKLIAVVDNQMVGVAFTNESHALTVVNEQSLPFAIFYNDQQINEANYSSLLGGGAQYTLSVTVPNDKVLNAVRLGETELTAVNGVYTFTMDADATLTIDARAKARYTVTINQPEGGTVGATYTQGTNNYTVASGDQVYEGTQLTLTATANSGYIFSNYIVNGSVYNNTTYTPTADVTISAAFEEGIPDYCTIDNTTTGTRYYVNTLTLSDGTNSVTVQGNGSSGTRAQYIDRTDNILTTTAGSEITVTLSAAGTWIHNYLYVDYGRDGVFDVDMESEELNGDLVSHTGYQVKEKHPNYNSTSEPNKDTADPTKCSDGTTIDNNQPWKHFPSFTLPANLAPGQYRVRYKMDWNSTDPCGRDNARLVSWQKADNGIKNLGTQIIDFTIQIISETLEAERTVTVASANAEYGTVAIVSPATEEASITTNEKNVVIEATPAEGYAFMNWTSGDLVIASAQYTYTGESDATFTANFGHTVTYGANVIVNANGQGLASGQVVAPNTEITLTVNSSAIPSGKEVIVTVNGEAVELSDSYTYTFTLDKNSEIDVQFVDKVIRLSILVSGEGQVEVWEGCQADNENLPAGAQYANGAVLPAFSESEEMPALIVFLIPADGKAAESATYSCGNGTQTATLYAMSEGLDFYKKATTRVFEIPKPDITDNLEISVVFGEDTAGIENIGIDEANGPVEYYNLQGIRVAAENLTSGFYIVRQGEKATKVFIRK